MKKRFTKGEKWLFASPLLLLALAVWQKTVSIAPKSVPMSGTPALPNSQNAKMLEFSLDSKRLVAFLYAPKTYIYSARIYDLSPRAKITDVSMPSIFVNSQPTNRGNERIYQQAAWSPDGTRIVAGSSIIHGVGSVYSKKIVTKFTIWDAKSGAVKSDTTYSTPDAKWYGDHFRFSSDGKNLIGEGLPPARFSANSGQPLNKLDAAVSQKSWSKWNEKLGLFAMLVRIKFIFQVVDLKTKRVLWQPPIRTVRDFEWHDEMLCVNDSLNDEDAFRAGIRNHKNRLWLWNAKTRKVVPSPELPAGYEGGAFAFSPDNRTLAYSYFKFDGREVRGKLALWDYRANRGVWYQSTNYSIGQLKWSPDGKRVLALGTKRSPYNLNDQIAVYSRTGNLRYERLEVARVARWSPDSKQLAIIISSTNNGGPTHIEIERFMG